MPLRGVVWSGVSTKAQANDDKYSLSFQESAGREFFRKENIRLVDVLVVKGHSRRYVDIHECSRDMSAEGITAFTQLLYLWDRQAFDVLWCLDGDRFARTQTLFAYVVERTIDLGARIFSMKDGWVDQNNYRMWIAMGGYKAADNVDRLVSARNLGMEKVAAKGLPTSGHVLTSHKLLRDDKTGKATKLVFDESQRQLWNDVARLLVAGTPYEGLELALYEQFGHVDPKTGKPYASQYFYRLLHNPLFWGHNARHYHGLTWSDWPYDLSQQPPTGVSLWPNTHEAVYTGQQAEQVIAEMKRRKFFYQGKAKPDSTHRFSGLLVCGSCGYTLTVGVGRKDEPEIPLEKRSYWSCRAGSSRRKHLFPCPKYQSIREDKVIAFLTPILHEALVHPAPDQLFNRTVDNQAGQIRQLEKDIAKLKDETARIVRKQSKAGDDVQDVYEEEISKNNDRLNVLKTRLYELLKQDTSVTESQVRQEALRELRVLEVANLWNQPSTYINQLLHKVCGSARLKVADHMIVDIVDKR